MYHTPGNILVSCFVRFTNNENNKKHEKRLRIRCERLDWLLRL